MRYRASRTIFAKNLRKRATEEERIVWAHLAAKRFLGFKFRRQEPIGPYIVDFVCFERRLVVELDGAHHDEVAVKSYDAERSRWLCEQGFRVLRFWNSDVRDNLPGVLQAVGLALEARSDPSP